jgi:peptidoglycan/xylan/chitin deacetylase (PgdA/CDA1 family)
MTDIAKSRLVLCYHAVSDHWPASLSVTREQLHQQLHGLLRRGYRPLRFTEAVLAPDVRGAFSVTFDDAFASVHKAALPVLRDLDVPATLFVPTGHVGGEPMTWPGIEHWTDGPHAAELKGCTWEEIAELAGAGWEIGSHTKSHARLSALDDDELDGELQESKEACEARVRVACTALAYPYGDYDARVVAAARRAGYIAAGTLPARIQDVTPLSYPRIYVSHGDDRLRFTLKTARAIRYLRRTALWDIATASARRRTPPPR